MGKAIGVSFENDIIKVVHASLKGENLFIERAEIFPYDQFDSYLRKERAKEFIVTYNFSEYYHDMVSVPSVSPKHLEKIVDSTIRRSIGIKNLSFIYTPLRGRIVENKKVMDVSYFAVKNEEIQNVVRRFTDNGKMVKALYPQVFSVAPLFKSIDEPVVGVIGTKAEKKAFLVKKGLIYFLRTFESATIDISDLDIHDINMTVNYCLQTIRITPSSIMLGGNLPVPHGLSVATPVPLVSLNKPDYIHSTKETFNEFIMPISSFYAHKASNILSKEVKNIYAVRKYMQYASMVFVILSLFCLNAYDLRNIEMIRGVLKTAESSNIDVEKVFSVYRARKSELNQYMPMVNFLNEPTADIPKLLIALTKINTNNLKIDSIVAVAGKDTFSVTIDGEINAGTYASIYTSFHDLIDSINKFEYLKIADKTINVDQRRFSIKVDYRG